MASKPYKTVCRAVGCNRLIDRSGYCEEHEKQYKKEKDSQRLNSNARGYNSRWRKARRSYLVRNPVCVMCGHIAEVVDHIRPHKGDQALFWDTGNWQPLCKPCHDRKTATEDGGFGNYFKK